MQLCGPAGHRCASPNRFPDGGRANKTAATSGGQSGPGRSSRTEAPRPPCPERAAGMARSKPPDRSDDGPRGARGTDMRKDEPGSYPAAALCKIRQKFRKDGTVVVLLLSPRTLGVSCHAGRGVPRRAADAGPARATIAATVPRGPRLANGGA
ncbi:unnamed protein product [Lampetra fluviatilis]